ncbi:PAS:GGDEF domain protein [gamma proteobacterium HdN1]|nr:PAS:GGDEF domain protein [gamma proteobacterium HdN1]
MARPMTGRLEKLGNSKSSVGKVILIMVLFIMINLLLLGMLYLQGNVLDGARAYVRGEGLWAKAQKDMVLHFTHYSYTHDPKNYQAAIDAYDVILGDRQGRLAMLASPPDRALARAGLERGLNDPKDTPTMVQFLITFQNEAHIHESATIWAHADTRVEELVQTGSAIRKAIENGAPESVIVAHRAHLRELDEELRTLEYQFSKLMADGARFVRNVTWYASIGILLMVMAISLLISRQIILSIARSEQQMRLAATVFAASNDGVLIMDQNLKILSANTALCRITGYTEAELTSHSAKILQSVFASELPLQEMEIALQNTGHWQTDVVERRQDGSLVPLQFSINSVYGADNVSHYVAIVSDISRRKAQEAQLRHIAHHDALTGLPNRILFNDRMEQIFKRAHRQHNKFAVIYLDLDNFKPVNDNFGHDTGDQLLQAVATRITEHVRGTDTVTRLGGDEFVILLEDIVDQEMAEEIAEKISTEIRKPFQANGHTVQVSASLGIALYPDHGDTARDLLHYADLGMYRRKMLHHGRSPEAVSEQRHH